MTEEEKAVEAQKAEAAAAEAKQPTELEKQLADKDALIAQLTVDKNNYKKGMLKAKGKLPKEEEDDEEEGTDDKINRLVKEALLDTQLVKAQQEKDEIIKNALARNKELETALKNRSQISQADAGGSSEQKLTAKDNVLSDEKIKALKGMGWDDKKIARYKENLMRLK